MEQTERRAQATRRRRVQGAVDRLPSKRWRARFTTPDGRRLTANFPTKADADRWLAAQTTDVGRGAWVDPRAGAVPLSDYATQWLSRRPGLRPRTRELYTYLLDRYIEPELGTTTLGQLTSGQVRAWNAELADRLPTTAAKAYRLLAAICRTAVADEMIVKSPCRVTGGGVEKAPERPVASIAEVAKLAEAMPERFRLVVELAAWCGLRRGEILGLRRRDIDLLHGTLNVAQAYQQMIDGSILFGPPKTEASRRTVAIPSNVIPALEGHLDKFVAAEADALLVTGQKGGPVRPHVLQKAWHKARVGVGRPDLHLHDLRHSGNTWAAAIGASTKELMARMGHANADAALRYQHATADRDKAIAEALASLAESASVTDLDSVRSRSGHADDSEATAKSKNTP
ncbi:MAG TPA: tyrosine-type recombinase/integrase [Acidimicrobiales bacterium]|nr:tyrosine-type recombinase/integrase [Acidimicrobiales bacterium]